MNVPVSFIQKYLMRKLDLTRETEVSKSVLASFTVNKFIFVNLERSFVINGQLLNAHLIVYLVVRIHLVYDKTLVFLLLFFLTKVIMLVQFLKSLQICHEAPYLPLD